MDLFTYLDKHAYVGFIFMCVVIPAMAWPITILINKFFILCSRVLRTINIATQGWPPEYLDADGDQWQPEDGDDVEFELEGDEDDESEKKDNV